MNCLLVLPTYFLLEEGISNFLCLETLRHGTCLKNYLSIQVHGGDPEKGGAENGSSKGRGALSGSEFNRDLCQKKFFVFKDSHFDFFCNSRRENFCDKRLLPRKHAYWSSLNVDENSSVLLNSSMRIVNVGLSCITPTIKFHFSPEEITNVMINDESYAGAAYYTQKPISASHLGITGALYQGLNRLTISRITENPSKSLVGLIQLTSGVYLTYCLTNRQINSDLHTILKVSACIFGLFCSL